MISTYTWNLNALCIADQDRQRSVIAADPCGKFKGVQSMKKATAFGLQQK